jgi:Glycosyltransferase family 87
MALLIGSIVRYVRQGEEGAVTWIQTIIQWSARSRILCCALIVTGAIGMGSRMLVGYLGSWDLFQDFIGAKEFAAGRSMNPPNMTERVDYWLQQDPLKLQVLDRWPALRKLQDSSIDNGARQVVVQAHPPFHVLLVAVIVMLCGTIQRTYLMMTAVTLACYAGTLTMLWRSVPAGFRTAVPAFLLCILAADWQPFIANLRQGQVGVVVALLVTAGWYSILRGRSVAGGVLIGLAALIKMYPALLLVWLLLRNRRAFLAAISTMSAAALFLYFSIGWSGFIDYTKAAKTVVEIFGRSRINYSLPSVVSYVVAGPVQQSMWASAVVVVTGAALLGYSILLVVRRSMPSPTEAALEFGIFVVLACLLSPTCEAFYYPILLLPMLTLLHTIRPEALLRSSIVLLAILCCLSFPDQVVWRSTELLKPMLGDRISWLLCSFPTAAMVALWYWMTARRQCMAEAGPV